MTYLRPFLAPGLASLAMLAGVLVLREQMAGEPAYMTLAGQVLGGAVVYCTVLAALDRRRIFQMRDLVLKRGAVSA